MIVIFLSFKIIVLLKCVFLHKHVKHSLLKLGRLCHYSIKTIFFGYLKTLSSARLCQINPSFKRLMLVLLSKRFEVMPPPAVDLSVM
jgi:hypothetical protein